MDFTYIVIVIVFFLLDKGNEAESLQKECLFLLYYHFPMEDSSEYIEIVLCFGSDYKFLRICKNDGRHI